MGGAKGEPGKYLERHSRGRGRINKATRTLWLVALGQYNRYAIAPFSKTPTKVTGPVQTQPESVNSRGHWCLPVTTPVVYFRLARSTIRKRVLTAMPVGPLDL